MRYIPLRRRTRYPLIFILLFMLTSGYYLFREKKPELVQLPDKTNGTVLEVHDGDTLSIMIASKVYRARLIGIDAPEMDQRPWGERAKRALRGMLKEGETVLVETDVERLDRYNRLLVYLFNKEGIFINEKMLFNGYAVLLTIPPNVKYVERFVIAEKKARQQKKGIWGRDGLKEILQNIKRGTEMIEIRNTFIHEE